MVKPDLAYNIRKQICEQQLPLAKGAPPCPGCSFILGTETKPFTGGENTVFALQDHTGREVCMRIQRASGEGVFSHTLRNDVRFREAIQRCRVSGFQNMIGYSLEPTSLIPSPFITLEWVHGVTLRWTDDVPMDIGDRNKVIHAIARITTDLLKVQTKGIPAKEYVTTRILRKIERAERGKYRGGGPEGCRKQFSLVDKYWIPGLDEAPHVLVHGDLGPLNIIVDEDFNVKSLIDLGWAEMVPLQFAAEYPRFLTHEPYDGIKPVFDLGKKDTDMMRRDRQFYLDCVRERALLEGGITHTYYQLLARPDECSRYWWFKAIFQSNIHEAMCACDWDPLGQTHLQA